MALVRIQDVVVPDIFTQYVQQETEAKNRIIQSGVATRDPFIDQLLQGGGLTFNIPSFRDLTDDLANVASDNEADRIVRTDTGAASQTDSVPKNLGTDTEIAIRMTRNQSWGSASLAADLAGADPMLAIANRVVNYRIRQQQLQFIEMMRGIIDDNATNDSNDFGNDISGGTAFGAPTSANNFSAEASIDAKVTLGDSMDDLGAVFVHSVVKARMMKNNLIQFIPDARGEVQIPTYLGMEVITDDNMPNGLRATFGDGAVGEVGVYETWFFGPGAVRWGVGSTEMPTEVERHAAAGMGGGQNVLFHRWVDVMHMAGMSYTGPTVNGGGPTNTELSAATSWNRVYPERKQIKFARLITREHA